MAYFAVDTAVEFSAVRISLLHNLVQLYSGMHSVLLCILLQTMAHIMLIA